MTTDRWHNHRRKSHYIQFFKGKIAVTLCILTVFSAVWNFWPGDFENTAQFVANEANNVSEKSSGFTIPIEKISVGMRVHAHNPELTIIERQKISEPDWSTFTVLDVEMTKIDGGIVEIKLLRSPEWIEQYRPIIGGTIPVASSEFDAMGESKVIAIRDAPQVDEGPGHVVTATFKHLSSEVLDLYVEGNDMPLGTTLSHPFWSVDRQRFVEASKLRHGETLRTMFDEHVKLRFINKRKSQEPVYNVTVYGEHTYFVGDDALLVHNNNGYDDETASGLAVVRRRNMQSRVVQDKNGREVTIWGQSSSSSKTAGHDIAIDNQAARMAESGAYEYITLQRNWRTATGRVGKNRNIPDLIGVRRDGRVDAVEVRSDSDTAAALRRRLQIGLNSLPKSRRGRIQVIQPEPN